MKIICYKDAVKVVKEKYIKNKQKDFTYHYLYILSIIVWYQMIDKRYNQDSYIPINIKILRSIVSKTNLNNILSDLKKWGVIECNNQYVVGMISKGYRIRTELRNGLKQYEIADKLINKKITQYKELKDKDMNKEGYGDLLRHLKSLKIDSVSALKYIRNNYSVNTDKYNQRFTSIKSIESGDWFYHKDIQGRIHTNITNMGSDIRRFLYIETGECLSEVDITNSQPLFLYCVMAKSDTICKKELNDYKRVVESGNFYEELNDNLFDFDRKEFKQQFYTDVLFGRNKSWDGKIAKAFKERWTSIYNYIKEQKKINHNKLALLLQSEESKFVIGICTKEYLKQTNYDDLIVTIHDSLLVNESNVDIALNIMNKMFHKHYDIKPRLGIKTIC